MDKLVHLCFYRIIIFFITISQCKNAYSRTEIKVFFAFCIIKVHSLTFIKGYLVSVVGMYYIIFYFIYYITCLCH